MPERPQYQLDKDAKRRAVQFTQRDDVRDFARSGIGQNYNRMMDLQSQKNPNLDQLKQARRQWNRYDKYNAGEMLGKTPQQMQNEYMGISRDLRQSNKPAYNKMYPLTGGFMDYADKGGIWGAMLSNLGKKAWKNRSALKELNPLSKILDPIVSAGSAIIGRDGIGGAIDSKEATPEILQNYADQTFPTDIHPGTSFYYDRPDDLEDFEDDLNAPIKRIEEEVYGGPRPHEEMPTFPDIYWGPEPHRGLPPLDVYEGPRPHEGIPWFGRAPIEDVEISDLPDEPLRVQKSDWVDDITETDTMPGSPFFPGNLLNLFKKDEVIPGYGTTYIDMEEPDERYEDYIDRGEEPPAIVPFNDSNREAGIASLYGQGPQWAETNRRYEDEYRDHIERTGERMTYEEFARAWENVHQGKPHAGLR